MKQELLAQVRAWVDADRRSRYAFHQMNSVAGYTCEPRVVVRWQFAPEEVAELSWLAADVPPTADAIHQALLAHLKADAETRLAEAMAKFAEADAAMKAARARHDKAKEVPGV